MLYGVDVSQFQNVINWDELNAVSNFAIIRVAYGTMPDTQFMRNQSEARRVRASAGPLGIGYYYFAYPTLLDPVTSANYFCDAVEPLQAGEILVLDLEGDIGQTPVAWSLSWLQQVEARTGVKSLMYLNQSLEQSLNWGAVVNNGNGLWLARYDGDKTGIPVAVHWPIVAMKQWTDADHVSGISGNVDGDMFNGDFNQFYAYGYKSSPTIPQPSPPPVQPQPTPPPIESPAPQPAPTPGPQPQPTPPVETPPTPTPAPTPPPVITPKPTSFWQQLLAFLRKWL